MMNYVLQKKYLVIGVGDEVVDVVGGGGRGQEVAVLHVAAGDLLVVDPVALHHTGGQLTSGSRHVLAGCPPHVDGGGGGGGDLSTEGGAGGILVRHGWGSFGRG